MALFETVRNGYPQVLVPRLTVTKDYFRARQMLKSDSFWFRPMPANAPLDPNSAAIMSNFVSLLGANLNPNMDNESYTPTVYFSSPSDPVATINYDPPPEFGTHPNIAAENFQNIRIPSNAVPAVGSDTEMIIYSPQEDKMTELWYVTKPVANGNTYNVAWGGTILNYSQTNGVHNHPYGVTAAGLSFLPGMITVPELSNHVIQHVIGIGVALQILDSNFYAPATRTDGTQTPGSNTISNGQYFRFPASLNLAAYNLHPITRAVALAGQRYGFVVWDRGDANLTIRLVNRTTQTGGNYPANSGIPAGTPLQQILKGGNGFARLPFEQLVVTQKGYVPPLPV